MKKGSILERKGDSYLRVKCIKLIDDRAMDVEVLETDITYLSKGKIIYNVLQSNYEEPPLFDKIFRFVFDRTFLQIVTIALLSLVALLIFIEISKEQELIDLIKEIQK
jgi:hypothetical protein